MIDIPSNTFLDVFNKYFVAGSVWYYKQFHFITTGQKRDKYIIILNPMAIDNRTYFVLPTSQVDKLTGNLVIGKDCFFISHLQNECFPLDTAVDVSNIQSLPYNHIKSAYINGPFSTKIEHKGALEPGIMSNIHDIAVLSSRISPKILKLIYPPV